VVICTAVSLTIKLTHCLIRFQTVVSEGLLSVTLKRFVCIAGMDVVSSKSTFKMYYLQRKQVKHFITIFVTKKTSIIAKFKRLIRTC
jgi:hypothetical protein